MAMRSPLTRLSRNRPLGGSIEWGAVALHPFCLALVYLGLVCLPVPTRADEAQALRLPHLFGDHMVVQRDRPLPIWGWSNPGSSVTVQFGTAQQTATAADDGTWRVELPPQPAGGPRQLVVQSGDQKLAFSDVWTGEVWICSGQSNMQWGLKQSAGGAEEIQAASHPRLRLFRVPMQWSDEPKDDCEGSWQVCTPESVADFSAVAYYFGKRISQELNLPVGLVGTYFGGTPAEAWTSPAALDGRAEFHDLWESTKNDANPQCHRCALFNAMIHPIVPFAMRGAIWYQGEGNVGRAKQYASLFPTMIRDWRRMWRQGDFPFYFVQLAPFRYGGTDPAACAELWEAQTQTLQLPNTGMAVTIDIGDFKDIHPANKRDVGDRLARWALSRTYGRRGMVPSGPLYHSHQIEGSQVRIFLDYVGAGLVTRDGKRPKEFTIAGPDGNFAPAEATIEGNTIVVSSPQVPQPTAVRFAWNDTAAPNLMNRNGLPAGPFRTDSFKMVTDGNVKP